MNEILVQDFILLKDNLDCDFQKNKGSKILITGAFGMIASYLSMFLMSVLNEYDLELFLQDINPDHARDIFGDLLDDDRITILDFNLDKELQLDIKFDYIIHAASPASTKFFVEKPVEVIKPNVIGTYHLLKYTLENNANLKKFVFFSSNSIYGEGGQKKEVLDETDYGVVDPLGERSSYIESKRIAEQMCRAFSKEYNINTTIVRISHCYGPTFNIKNDTRIIPRVIKSILEEKDVEIFKDPDSLVQYTYILDTIFGILKAMMCGESGEAYNVAGDEIINMNEAINWLFKADKNIKSHLIEKEIDSSYPFGKGKGINFKKISNEKLKTLGWRQLVTNEDGFKRTMIYFLNKTQ